MSTFANSQEYMATIIGKPVPKTEDKPVVKYKRVRYASEPRVGDVTAVIPVDHPAGYLNGRVATTSYIVAVGEDGSFETRNTRYVLDK